MLFLYSLRQKFQKPIRHIKIKPPKTHHRKVSFLDTWSYSNFVAYQLHPTETVVNTTIKLKGVPYEICA